MKGEAAFVAALRHLVHDPAARGLADDCAVIEFGGEALVLTHDMMVEGVHVLADADPADTAWKLVAVNLSDLAAKGARPVGVLLGHMLGERDDRFLTGLHDALTHYGVPLLGGDTVSGKGSRAWGLTAVGRATHRPVPSRAGANLGDEIWITGELGAAMLGFEAIRDKSGADSTAYRRPMARLVEGELLAPVVTAMMDVSDGLLLDASRMAEASGATFALESKAIPLATHPGRLPYAVRWGDDYELLFTVPPGTEPPVKATRIGRVRVAGKAGVLLDDAVPEGSLGYEHG